MRSDVVDGYDDVAGDDAVLGKVACNMLRHLDESSLTIANYLGFSSQSHFIQVFKKSTGMTPEEYRRKNYHQSWMGDTEE